MANAKRNANAKKLQGKRILVVEDQPLIGEMLVELLRRYAHPFRASSGGDALEQIKHKAPHIILLDLSLPDINGLEVVRLLRRNEKTGPIPILAMSGNPIDKANYLKIGCNDFILKPFNESSLLAQLSALI